MATILLVKYVGENMKPDGFYFTDITELDFATGRAILRDFEKRIVPGVNAELVRHGGEPMSAVDHACTILYNSARDIEKTKAHPIGTTRVRMTACGLIQNSVPDATERAGKHFVLICSQKDGVQLLMIDKDAEELDRDRLERLVADGSHRRIAVKRLLDVRRRAGHLVRSWRRPVAGDRR